MLEQWYTVLAQELRAGGAAVEAVSTIATIRGVLRSQLGRRWPLFLLGCAVRGRALIASTRWATAAVSRAEARYASRLALASAVYLSLSTRIGQPRAYNLMRQLLLAIGCMAPRRVLTSMNDPPTSAMDRLMAFQRRMQQSDAGRFNTRVYRTVDATTCHYTITRCIVSEVFTAAGTPELTRLICEVDRVFFAQAFREFAFSRGDSWENTIAYGRQCCEFILTLRTP